MSEAVPSVHTSKWIALLLLRIGLSLDKDHHEKVHNSSELLQLYVLLEKGMQPSEARTFRDCAPQERAEFSSGDCFHGLLRSVLSPAALRRTNFVPTAFSGAN